MVRGKYGCAFWLSLFFCQFVNGLTELYPELYDSDAGYSSKIQANFGKKWKSYATIVELANGDVEKIDTVVNQPLEKCLLLLAYKSDKAFMNDLMHKEAMKSIR